MAPSWLTRSASEGYVAARGMNPPGGRAKLARRQDGARFGIGRIAGSRLVRQGRIRYFADVDIQSAQRRVR